MASDVAMSFVNSLSANGSRIDVPPGTSAGSIPGRAIVPARNVALGRHQVREDVVDARQVALAFGLEPFEDPRIEADTDGNLRPDVAPADHAGQLSFGRKDAAGSLFPPQREYLVIGTEARWTTP
jgi:hypothetical protein